MNIMRIKALLRECIESQLDEDMIADAIVDGIGNMDFRDEISRVLDDAIAFKLEEAVGGYIEEIVGEVVSDTIESIFD